MMYVCCPLVYIDTLKQPFIDLPLRYGVCLLSISLYRQIKTTIDKSTYTVWCMSAVHTSI